MLIQRVEVSSLDIDAGPRRNQARPPPPTAINGGFSPTAIFMRPGAVERWRVLNASVDGRGTKSFMVLEGQFVFADRQLWKCHAGREAAAPRVVEPATRQDVARGDADHLPAVVRRHHARHGRERPRAAHDQGSLEAECRHRRARSIGSRRPGEDPPQALLRNVEDCYRDGESLRNLFVRPNQVFLTNANRADVFFKAPLDAAGKVYTIFAQEFLAAHRQLPAAPADRASPRGRSGFTAAQSRAARRRRRLHPCRRRAGAGRRLRRHEPPRSTAGGAAVSCSRSPTTSCGSRRAEATRRKVPAGSFRTRVMSYSGTVRRTFR